jgi:hypothetical protein
MADTLTANQRRTAAARAAYAASFESPEEKTAHYRALGQKSAEGRIALPADEARAFVAARDELARLTEIIGRIAERVERRSAEEGATDAA